MFEKIRSQILGRVVRLFCFVCVFSFFITLSVRADLIICSNIRMGCADTGKYTRLVKTGYSLGLSKTSAYLNLAKAISNTQTKKVPVPKYRQPSLSVVPKNVSPSLVIRPY